jgi:glycerol-3-phosphate O-acyltransferase
VHAFAEASIVARAFLSAAEGKPGIETPQVRARALSASRLLKLELVFKPAAGFDAVFAQSVRELAAAGWLVEGDARLEATAEGRLALPVLAGLTQSYLEAYRLLGRTAQAFPKLAGKDLVARAGAEGEKALLLGDLARREALSRPYFENAVLYLEEAGALANRSRIAAILDELTSIR